MKRFKVAAVIILSGLLLYGCKMGGESSQFPPEQSTIYVSRDGEVYTALVKEYDTSHGYYSAEELKAMAEQEAAEYNAEYPSGQEGAAAVSLTECSLENGTAKVVYRYLTGDDLCRFTEAAGDQINQVEDFKVSTVADGLGKMNETGGTWVEVKNNSTIDPGEIMKKSKLNLVVITGGASVQTEGKILYYSGNVNLKDEFTAQVTEGSACLIFK
ncbi:MAG: hypothetical protein HFG66_00045 [Hungatella sp.]|nr:hypothetical protein [Hungatella sp.]